MEYLDIKSDTISKITLKKPVSCTNSVALQSRELEYSDVTNGSLKTLWITSSLNPINVSHVCVKVDLLVVLLLELPQLLLCHISCRQEKKAEESKDSGLAMRLGLGIVGGTAGGMLGRAAGDKAGARYQEHVLHKLREADLDHVVAGIKRSKKIRSGLKYGGGLVLGIEAGKYLAKKVHDKEK